MASQLKVGGTAYFDVSEGVGTLTDGSDTITLSPSAGITAKGITTTAALTVQAADVVVDYPATGGSLTLRRYDSGVTAVATGGAATTLTLAIPAAARLESYALKVTTTIAGIDSTTGTLALTGGNTETIGTISAFSAGTKLTKAAPGGVDLTTTAATNASFTLSGGADNTPSAGAVRLVVWAWVTEELD